MSHNILAIGEQLREAGFRLTLQRQFILDAVCGLGGHVSADEVYQQVHAVAPSLNRATVYRNLQFLVDQALLTVTHTGGGRLGYELADNHLHHHLLCTACGHSIEIDHAALHAFYERMATQHQFQIGMKHITFQGVCYNCQEQSKGASI
jgi:Fe2+ or Zn2+ uptake regulation protein